MTINGMTDKKIIKALECCQTSYDKRCEECPYQNYKFICNNKMKKDALDLINRQKAEIERSNCHIQKLVNVTDDLVHECDCAKQEAIKAYAERLKEKAYPFPCAIGVEHAVTIRAINDLAKEMTGEQQ